MKLVWIAGIGIISAAALFGTCLLVMGCGLHRPTPGGGIAASNAEAAAAPIVSNESSASSPELPVASVRVGGDREASITFQNGNYRAGECRITTPLPEGYPEPTPPGAIDLKRYPQVRRAEIGGTITPDWGMNFAFFPLFNHIKRREIAMTSPVEVNYAGLGRDAADRPDSWTMSFLYRTPDLGPAGVDPDDQRLLIEDIPPVTVVAIGMRGPYLLEQVKEGLEQLRAWLSQQSEWEEAGDPRALFYNGPDVRARDLWSEVQLPLRRR